MLPPPPVGATSDVRQAMAELAESRETYMEDGDDTNDHEVWGNSGGSCG